MKRKKVTEIFNKNKPLSKYPWWQRWIVFVIHYFSFAYDEIKNLLSNLSEETKRKTLIGRVIVFWKLFFKKAKQESIMKESAALTYITLLGFIPFLVFVMFLIPKLPFLQAESKLGKHFYENILPNSAIDVGQVISQLLNQTTTINIFNILVAMITSWSLFTVIRDTFDRILVMDYHPPKDFLSQFIKFFGTIIFGFIIIFLLFSSSSIPVISSVLDYPMFKSIILWILPFATQFMGLIFLYLLLPTIKISRKSLFRGAFWTTVFWVLIKSLFDYYIFYLTNIDAVWGVLKSLPIFLMWIYINWVIILGGMVLVAVMEQKDKTIDTKYNKRHYVRLTLEMYTDDKMQKNLEQIVSKDAVKEIIEEVTREDFEI